MQIIEIDMASPAGRELRELLADPLVYRIRISPEHWGPGTVALKANEWTWSPGLSTTVVADHFSRPLSVDIREPHSPLSSAAARARAWALTHGEGPDVDAARYAYGPNAAADAAERDAELNED